MIYTIQQLRSSISKELLALLVVGFLAIAALTMWNQSQVTLIEARYVENQVQTVLDHKRNAVEHAMGAVYDEARTISLLPSVRNITGGNRKSDSEDVVKDGRLTHEGHQTVQQIFNNLASRVHVSEVYAVMEGLNPTEGEVPFFMYDTPVMDNAKDAKRKDEAPNQDRPEEAEEAEYKYFPNQIAQIRAAHPKFEFKTMDEVPAFVSPLMRTCDNEQYVSVKDGNEKDSYGLLYSVPFYAKTGELRGVISAIIRANTLEALLLDTPFVPITKADLAEQKQAGWTMPEPSRFILSNEKYGIYIQDRRTQDLQTHIAQGVPERNTFKVSLSVHSDSPWELKYYLPESDIRAASEGQRQAFWLLLSVVVGALLAASLAIILFARLRKQLGAPATTVLEVAHRIAEGDLTADVQGAHTDDTTLLAALKSTTVQLCKIAKEIKLEADSLGEYSNEITNEVSDLADRTQGQANSLAAATETMRKLGLTVQENATNTKTATELAHQASKVAVHGGEIVEQVVHTMRGINDSSKRISDIISVIDTIAFQTNILALNAAVEAARAGEQGRGFAVVAGEVRNLAKRCADAAHEIKDLITTSVVRVEQGTEEVGKAGETMREVVSAIQRVNASVEQISRVSAEQISGLSDVGSAVTHLDEVTHQNAALVEQLSATTKNLDHQSKALLNTVSIFKT